jgi:hypothetical protein
MRGHSRGKNRVTKRMRSAVKDFNIKKVDGKV